MNLENSTDEYGNNFRSVDFSRIKVGIKNLDDAIVTLGDYKKVNSRLSDKQTILQAINNYDLDTMRDASNFFYRISGIYSRLCRYMAYLYRYDWMITPYIEGDNMKNGEKALSEFNKALLFFDNSELKRLFGEIALKVLRNGCYYGYLIPSEKRMSIQELPVKYCRTRYSVNGRPAIEFNMKFFDDYYRDTVQRMKILNLFPAEFKKGYSLYKQGKLVPDFQGDTSGWYLLDPSLTVKFNVNGEDFPALISVIPAIIDLDEAQELDRKKMAQQLLKIIIQKMPMDKNGDLVFDVDEAKELHNNAVQMLGKAIGIDVLTTFADVEVADMADKSTTTTTDELEKVERTVYNAFGVSNNLFNTDGNISLEKSILNDEGAVRTLLLQFGVFFDRLTQAFGANKKKYNFRLYMLETTQYNYKDLSKMYKEQVQMGYSKMLPQIALGHSQSSILNTVYFENKVLNLSEIMIPPLLSSTINGEDILGKSDQQNAQKSNNKQVASGEENSSGRPEKPDDQKSDKTIQNKESMS